MREILYDGKHEVTIKEVLEKINYYLNLAEEGQAIYEKDKKKAFDIAKNIRQSLEKEYKNNNLKRIENIYESNRYFLDYSGAVHDVVASIVGRLTYSNLYSFLYDVSDYMKWKKNSLQGRLKIDASK
ncbi:hypothetical protein DW1_1151 [Proteiniborus sp. DW1]|uniref:hypothetical protein n=1 Tax=Proteiniborus sp. DW1 TaxID=1889883 RepID=UPI00092E1B04|nr:hypothetical protein [Proteiniborus sp. DW1]SCG82724.1 hypothetical protein DW1_1151 [Proteiniborus sp. DW1]